MIIKYDPKNMVRNNGTVRSIQEMLKFLGFKARTDAGWKELDVDGTYGPETESAVIDFQASEGLLRDGIVGPMTMQALEKAWAERTQELSAPGIDAVDGMPDRYVFDRVPADPFNEGGYDRLMLRNDVAEAYRKVYKAVHAKGGLMTSSGGIRSLHATVNASRSTTSMHYVGRALDLYIYSGMVNPEHDAYVIRREAPRVYRVFARCGLDGNPDAKLPPERTLNNIITYQSRVEGQSVTGHFLNLTRLFEQHGFKSIRARRRFEEGASMMGAEWWHFQYENGLIEHVTTFGSELLKVYARKTLEGTSPWQHRDRVFGINWA